jgi:TadE-like protein
MDHAVTHAERPRRGQAMIELGIVVVVFAMLTMGAVQFGYAFMVLNMITHAARDGAHTAASWAQRDGGSCGRLPALVTTSGGSNPVEQAVRTEINTVYAGSLNVSVCQGNDGTETCPSGVTVPDSPNCGSPTNPVVMVNVRGCVPYLLNILNLGTVCDGGQRGFTVNRTVWFRDEKRA